jgi:hypothetical protein
VIAPAALWKKSRWQVVQRGESPQRLQRAQHVLQRVARRSAGPQRRGGAIEGAADRRALAGDEGTGSGVQPEGLRLAQHARGAARQLLQLVGQPLGARRVVVIPRRDTAHQDLEIVDGADRQGARPRVPAAPPFAQAARQRLEPCRRTRDRGLTRHQRAAAQRPREPHEFVGSGRPFGCEQPVQPLQVLPRLEGEEVGHSERGAGSRRGGHRATNIMRER